MIWHVKADGIENAVSARNASPTIEKPLEMWSISAFGVSFPFSR